MPQPTIYDMNIYYSADRCAHISEIIHNNAERQYNERELESMANYILYGKEQSGKSIVDRKQVEIRAKNANFSRKAPVSLDELQESPTFDERTLMPLQKQIYKVCKPSIDREKDADIPGIVELWEVIDKLQHKLDVNLGKKEDDTIPKLNGLEVYYLRHFLIDIRRQQFYMKDSAKPSLGIHPFNLGPSVPPYILWNDPDSLHFVAPLGIMYGRDSVFWKPETCAGMRDYVIPEGKNILNFANKEHIYELLERYGALRQQVGELPQAPLWYIMDTLDFYVEKADLADSRMHILVRKVDKATNETIRDELREIFGLSYNVNYISTIWKQEICGKIAAAATYHKLQWDNRNNPENWKKCAHCGRLLLRDGHDFVKKKRSRDGFSGHCKRCDKKKRDAQNGG